MMIENGCQTILPAPEMREDAALRTIFYALSSPNIFMLCTGDEIRLLC